MSIFVLVYHAKVDKFIQKRNISGQDNANRIAQDQETEKISFVKAVAGVYLLVCYSSSSLLTDRIDYFAIATFFTCNKFSLQFTHQKSSIDIKYSAFVNLECKELYKTCLSYQCSNSLKLSEWTIRTICRFNITALFVCHSEIWQWLFNISW